MYHSAGNAFPAVGVGGAGALAYSDFNGLVLFVSVSTLMFAGAALLKLVPRKFVGNRTTRSVE